MTDKTYFFFSPYDIGRPKFFDTEEDRDKALTEYISQHSAPRAISLGFNTLNDVVIGVATHKIAVDIENNRDHKVVLVDEGED